MFDDSPDARRVAHSARRATIPLWDIRPRWGLGERGQMMNIDELRQQQESRKAQGVMNLIYDLTKAGLRPRVVVNVSEEVSSVEEAVQMAEELRAKHGFHTRMRVTGRASFKVEPDPTD